MRVIEALYRSARSRGELEQNEEKVMGNGEWVLRKLAVGPVCNYPLRLSGEVLLHPHSFGGDPCITHY